MLKTRLWVALCATPVVIASAFWATPVVIASVGHFSWRGSPHELSPERMMSIAQTFEQQGQIAKARELYEQILAKEPDSEEARRRLTKIIAAEQRGNRTPSSATVAQSNRAKSSVARKAPAAVPALARRVASRPVERSSSILNQQPTQAKPTEYSGKARAEVPAQAPQVASTPVERPSSILDQHPKQAKPTEYIPMYPTKKNKTVTNWTSPRSTVAKQNRPAAIVDVRDQPAVHASTVLPEKHVLVSSTMPQPVSFRGVPGEILRASDQFSSARHPATSAPATSGKASEADSVPSNDCAQAEILLGALGREEIAALPSVREEMRATQDSFLRIELAQTVLQIQPEDAEAIGILLELLRTTDDSVKWNAAFALRTSASPRTTFVVDALLETLVSNNQQLRRMVFLTLGAFGPAAAKAVPELEAALDSPDPRTRVVAEAALATIVPGRHRGVSMTQDPKSNQVVRFE